MRATTDERDARRRGEPVFADAGDPFHAVAAGAAPRHANEATA